MVWNLRNTIAYLGTLAHDAMQSAGMPCMNKGADGMMHLRNRSCEGL